ncbi:MAG: hypothetical protein JO051_03545 [Acidobacteriaceae bacterium]|nr:hypothetical protein [Acidobacteriaceae bacterium]
MQTLRALLDSPAVNVFLGTLPLLLTLAWGLVQNDRRFASIEGRLNRMDHRFDRMDARFDRIDTRLEGIDAKLANVSERLVKVETKIEGGNLVLAQ